MVGVNSMQSGGPDFGRGKCGDGKTARELTLSARPKTGWNRRYRERDAAMVRKQEIERNRRYRKIHKEACDLEIVTVTITKLPYGPQGTGKVLSYDITKHDIM